MGDMHISMQRLYQAARGKKLPATQSGLARLLNVSPQMVKNWEARGISKDGALKAQRVTGVDANILLDQADDGQYFMPSVTSTSAIPCAEPVAPFHVSWPFATITPDQWQQLDPAERAHIEMTAKILISAKGPPANQRRPGSRTATA